MMKKFPEKFYWGGAISAIQVESTKDLKSQTNWDIFYKNNKTNFFDGIGPDNTCDHLKHFKDDLKLFKEVGCNSFRTSILWARIFPKQNEIDYESVKRYHEYFDYANELGLDIFLTLNHFDVPDWVYEKKGFESKEVVEEFVKFSKLVLDEYGNKIKVLCTFNEPLIPILHGYLSKIHPPAIIDPKRAVQAAYGMVLAHAKVSNLFYEEYKNKYPNLMLSVILNLTPAVPRDGIKYTKEDKIAAEYADTLLNDSLLYPMVKGVIDKKLVNVLSENNLIPEHTQNELSIIRKTKIDILGINYYHPSRVVAPNGNETGFLKKFFVDYNWDKARINVFRGWEILPKSIYDLGMIVKNKFNNIPWYISENGMGVENEHLYKDEKTNIIQDDYRIAFISEHLEWLHKVIEAGSNCKGYHLWSLIDNWSFRNAFKNRYGLIEMDLNTKKRTIKKSGYWFKELTSTNALTIPYKKIEDTIDLKNIKYKESYN